MNWIKRLFGFKEKQVKKEAKRQDLFGYDGTIFVSTLTHSRTATERKKEKRRSGAWTNSCSDSGDYSSQSIDFGSSHSDYSSSSSNDIGSSTYFGGGDFGGGGSGGDW